MDWALIIYPFSSTSPFPVHHSPSQPTGSAIFSYKNPLLSPHVSAACSPSLLNGLCPHLLIPPPVRLIPSNPYNLYPITPKVTWLTLIQFITPSLPLGFMAPIPLVCHLSHWPFLLSCLVGSFSAMSLNVEGPQSLVCEPSVIFHPHPLSGDFAQSLKH